MSRLPTPGSDNNQWGQILNDYLSQVHNSDGTLKDDSVSSSQLQDDAVTTDKIAAGAITNPKVANGALAKTKLDSSVQASLDAADSSLQISNDLSDVSDTSVARENIGAQTKIILRPEDPAYGAVGNGTTDDTAAVQACFAAANALRYMVGTYGDPGATVLLNGRYNLASLAAPVDVMCNVESEGAYFYTPSGYTGTAIRVGHTTSAYVMQNMHVVLPSVIGAGVVSPPLPVGSVGVLVRNIYSSTIIAAKIAYQETGLQVGGESWGAAYNQIQWRTITFCKIAIALKNIDASGWSNQNTYIAGSVSGSTAWAGRRASGYRAVLLDGSGSNSITGNTFVGCSFESDVFEHVIEFNSSYQNQFYGCRHEQGIAAASVTVSGDTITSAGHVMAVDEMIMFTGSAAAGGMSFDTPYYVVAVPDANTFKVAIARSGTPITFTSSGTSVKYSRPQRVKYTNSFDNVIDLPMTPLTWMEKVEVGSSAATSANHINYAHMHVFDTYISSVRPPVRVRNRNAGSPSLPNPIVAVYPYDTSPTDSPESWSHAMSVHGPYWASGVVDREGTGTPEGSVVAPIGSTYRRRNGSSGTTFYVKESGTSNTGWVPYSGGGQAPDLQTFTADGTWAKPAGAVTVQVEIIGGGGGGGSGARRASGILATGGAGGGGGGLINYTFNASELSSSVAVVVGQGGTGASTITIDDTNGSAGSAATSSTFGNYLKAWGGNGGGGGTSTAAASGGAGGASLAVGGTGASSSGSGGAGGSSNANLTGGPPGGAAGGGITNGSPGTPANGGAGGTSWSSNLGGTGGSAGVVDTTNPTNGGSVTAGVPLPGGSPGGGASSVTTAAQAGGNGGAYGGGGAGGGASRNGANSGAGGNGANGIVRVVTYF